MHITCKVNSVAKERDPIISLQLSFALSYGQLISEKYQLVFEIRRELVLGVKAVYLFSFMSIYSCTVLFC